MVCPQMLTPLDSQTMYSQLPHVPRPRSENEWCPNLATSLSQIPCKKVVFDLRTRCSRRNQFNQYSTSKHPVSHNHHPIAKLSNWTASNCSVLYNDYPIAKLRNLEASKRSVLHNHHPIANSSHLAAPKPSVSHSHYPIAKLSNLVIARVRSYGYPDGCCVRDLGGGCTHAQIQPNILCRKFVHRNPSSALVPLISSAWGMRRLQGRSVRACATRCGVVGGEWRGLFKSLSTSPSWYQVSETRF